MSLTNPNKVVTEQRLNEYHNAILPYLGGMPEMVANKFSKGDLYSTEEKMIGQWIDGKPLYQKTFEFSSKLVGNGNTWINTNIPQSTINNIIFGFGKSDNQFYPITINCDTYINIMHFRNTNIGFNSITIQYTKTTDSPISIGSDTDYSTEEKIVGTWIDGKPLYQKTILISSQSAATEDYPLSNFGITNYDKTIAVWGILPNVGVPIGYYYSNGNYLSANVGSDKSLSVAAPTQANNFPLYVTLQYTKTTD